MAGTPPKPRLGVFKFASCDGCQLSLLDCEDELLAVAGAVEIAYFLEAGCRPLEGKFDLALVEGSISTPSQLEQIKDVRQRSRFLVTIGACATAGGIQALRNWGHVHEFLQAVYARPEYIQTLATSTPIAEHVPVDFELRGCPINKHQLLEVIAAFLAGRRPNVPGYAVCVECKRAGIVCVMVAQGISCLGPITHAGCGAICPAYDRGCYGCYGPAQGPNVASLARQLESMGVTPEAIDRLLHTFNAWAPEFRAGAGQRLGLKVVAGGTS
jgi:coenzyme F420-reducing hydrogenase gamma subunit